MPRRKFRELVEPLLADPVERERIEEMKRAGRIALALGRLCDGPSDERSAESEESAAVPAQGYQIQEEDSLFLATLKDHIEELGGRLEIVAVFPDRRVPLVE